MEEEEEEGRFGAILFKKDSLSGEAITDKGKRSGARFVTGVFGHRDFSGYASDGAKEFISGHERGGPEARGGVFLLRAVSSSSRVSTRLLGKDRREERREREREEGEGKKRGERVGSVLEVNQRKEMNFY